MDQSCHLHCTLTHKIGLRHYKFTVLKKTSSDSMVTMRSVAFDSFVGAKLYVPEYWWVDTATGKHLKGSRLWKGEIVCIDITSPGRPLFFFECYDGDGPYPMEFRDVLRFRYYCSV